MHLLDAEGRPVDPVQATDVARWRKAERERLLALRMALDAEYRARATERITRELDGVLPPNTAIVSTYFPIRAEPDLRPWMRELHAQGIRVAVPVVVAKGQPLEFREWEPGARLAYGVWRIPYPADGAVVRPDVAIAPLVGFDAECYRLGYGGGFFDRTLASLQPRALAIGIGYPEQSLPTIFPQAFDVPMDWIAIGDGAPRRRRG
ncbi:MAG: 5-formyltetrahydrofolate cyclo-ligase [Proteobacteria bacterium]|nr:5-formyltetrahydrofolate cyclo-ligase [Pseudomonadota bacterium]